jgi:hypothetical protein
MIIKELRTKSRERKRKDSAFKCFSKSPEEGKPRISASSSKKAFKSTNLVFIIIKSLLMKAAILVMSIMMSIKVLEINTSKMVSI